MVFSEKEKTKRGFCEKRKNLLIEVEKNYKSRCKNKSEKKTHRWKKFVHRCMKRWLLLRKKVCKNIYESSYLENLHELEMTESLKKSFEKGDQRNWLVKNKELFEAVVCKNRTCCNI